MKISFLTPATDVSAVTLDSILLDYEIQIEGSWFDFKKVMPFFKKMNVGYVSGLQTASIYRIWLDFPVVIQAIRTNTGAAVSFEYLDQQREVVYKNFNEVTVNEFQKGKLYSIPVTAGTPTDCNPDLDVFPIQSGWSAESFYSIVSPYYSFMATEQFDVRGGQSFQGIMCDFIPSAVKANILISAPKKRALNEVLLGSSIKTAKTV